MSRIGVLAVQGAFAEHERVLADLGAECFDIRKPSDLDRNPDALVIPGGESTVMAKLLGDMGMTDRIRGMVFGGMPVLGTCAGMILLASGVEGGAPCLGTLPMTVRRNAYGRQLGSFSSGADFAGLGEVPLRFIRAPSVVSLGEGTETLCSLDGVPVAVRNGRQIATAFHPELTGDATVHGYFLDLVRGLTAFIRGARMGADMEQNGSEWLYEPSRRYMDCASPDFDPKRAEALAEQGASEGNPDARYLHGLFLYLGEGGAIADPATAAEMFSLAEAEGHMPASIVSAELKRNEPEVQRKVMELRLRGEERDTAACARLFELYDNGSECVRKSHAEAVRFYTVCAENDDPVAQRVIGFMHLKGKGIPKNPQLAVRWLKAAADNGDANAMYRLGQMYDEGTGDAEPDLKTAVQWYEKAAAAGDRDAQFAMGCIHSMPKTRWTSDQKAAEMFEKAAEQGHDEAQYQLGMMLAYGQGVQRDPSRALYWLEKSCENGYQQAMVDLANMSFEGQVLPKDFAKAAKWFTEAANMCNGYAQYALGCMYGSGYYFERDDEESFKWFSNAAEGSEPNSQYCLGCMYYEGRGCERDPEKAAMWLDQAADQGHPGAKSMFAMMKITGSGVEKDVEGGLEILNEVADAGYYEAQYYLGKIYYEGEIVKRNIPRAKKLLGLAARQGDPDAAELLERIRSERSR